MNQERVSVECPTGKIAYAKRGEARLALAHHQTAGGATRRVYRCPDCRAYHLTKQR